MFIPLEDANIFSITFGQPSAFPILGIGGWIGSWELWSGPFSILSASWQTIAYDHRGTGATTASHESITLDRLVADLVAVLDHYRVDRCILAAESAGALVALTAAKKFPQRISGLVLVDAYYFNGVLENNDPFLAGLKSNYSQTLNAFVEACVPETNCEPIKRWGRQILDRASPEAAIALYRMTQTVDLRQEIGSINQPTLILHGDADKLVPLESAQWLAKTMPNATFTVLSGAGHVPTMTRPHEVAKEIMDFLKNFDK
jgi:pimeloyl-ACP methyl ester carboxylesterase